MYETFAIVEQNVIDGSIVAVTGGFTSKSAADKVLSRRGFMLYRDGVKLYYVKQITETVVVKAVIVSESQASSVDKCDVKIGDRVYLPMYGENGTVFTENLTGFVFDVKADDGFVFHNVPRHKLERIGD